MKDIYFSLDEARAELARRRQNSELCAAVEAELGAHFLPECREQPRAFLSWQLLTPNNGFDFFMQAAHYVGALPFAGEFLGDTFTHGNREKQGWGRLRATDGKCKLIINIFSFQSNDRKMISEVVTHTGESLTDFHHRLLDINGYRIDYSDMTDWYRAIGKPAEYYYPFLLHFVVHGVWFENPVTADDRENGFANTVIIPAKKRIEERYGLRPLIVRLFPDEETQTEEEDFYWWCYPPRINDYLVRYAKENNLPVRYLD